MTRALRHLALSVPLLASLAHAQDRRITPTNASGRRLALVVGNNTYLASPLANSVRDAQAMKSSLEAAGFNSVRMELNTSQQRLDAAIENFVASIRPGDVALFYYSGHGIQLQDQNYLIPVDFQAGTAVQAKYQPHPVNHLV